MGPAAQIGADYALGHHLLLNASVRYIRINTNAHIDTGASSTKVNVRIAPMVYSVGHGYYF